MSKPIYNSDGININLDCKVTRKNNPTTWFFELKNEAIKYFNEKVFGNSLKNNGGNTVATSCTLIAESYKDEVIKFLESKNLTVEELCYLSIEEVERFNSFASK